MVSPQFDFEIPAPIFADGFESGDVSAWSYTKFEFGQKKKMADTAQARCSVANKESSSP